MSIKLSKKDLETTGIEQDAFHLGGNVYNYENAIYYLQIKDLKHLEKSVYGEDVKHLINYLKHYDMDKINISIKQLFYSSGTYGNNGQLHQVNIFENDKRIDTIFVYYC